jgi:hypothetical protein
VSRKEVGVGLACVALAIVSLLVPASLAFDAWAWLVWGREALHLDLATTAGPAWKPLPVLVTTPLALLGGLAPAAWLVVARAAGFAAVALAFSLARRLGGLAAGIIATVGLLLTPDGGPRFLRLVAEGHSAPAEAALALWAAASWLDGRHRRAIVLLTLLGLLRPETWPILGLYGLWLWRRDAGSRPLLVGLAAVIPVLWFGGDWLGSGDPLHGAGEAQVIDDPLGSRLLEGLDHAAKVIVLPLWVGVAAAVVTARRRGERRLLTLTLVAVAWSAIVVAMGAGLRYAALSRFFLPAGALLCVLGAVGLVRLVQAVPAGRARGTAIVGLTLLAVVFAGPRVVGLADVADDVSERQAIEDDLLEVVDEVGRDRLLACGPVVADPRDLPQTALAWELDVPIDDVNRRADDDSYVAVVGTDGRMIRALAEGEVLAANERWTVIAVGCS